MKRRRENNRESNIHSYFGGIALLKKIREYRKCNRGGPRPFKNLTLPICGEVVIFDRGPLRLENRKRVKKGNLVGGNMRTRYTQLEIQHAKPMMEKRGG